MQRTGNKLESNPSDDICPVCKSNRYLNPKLEFLINPECYHKMCSTCVDRIFTSGPASCPVPYCGKTLRKRGFHKAFFGDLNVEREVDIRRRVGSIFNKRQDEFETLRDWNDYLDEVECLIFDLVEGSREDRVRAEGKLRQYEKSNAGDIEENKKAGLEAIELEKKRAKLEKEATRQRRLAALQELEEEKKDIEQSRRDLLERLANTDDDAVKITAQARKIVLKKTSARRSVIDNLIEGNGSAREGLTIRGLKKKEVIVAEESYDPFDGLDLTPSRYVLQADYDSEWITPVKSNDRHTAGGYSVQEYCARAMFEAFSGLGVIIGDEIGNQALSAASSILETTAALGAARNHLKLEQNIGLEDVY